MADTPFAGHPGAVQAVAVTPDGTQIVTAGTDGTIRIWDRITGVQVAGTALGIAPKAPPLAEVSSDEESGQDLLDIRPDVQTVQGAGPARLV